MQIDIAAFTDYALDTFDCSPDYEDDAFAVTFEGIRIYVERKRTFFDLHIGAERYKLPRC